MFNYFDSESKSLINAQEVKAPPVAALSATAGNVCVEGLCVPVEVFKAEFAGYKEGDLPPVNQVRQALLQSNAQVLQCQAQQLQSDNVAATPKGYKLEGNKYVK